MKAYRYVTNCVNADGDEINRMRDHKACRTISYAQMRRQCAGLLAWARNHGYELRKSAGLTLKDDWHVSYHRSVFRNRPCYYLVWSGIEHIWQVPF